MYTGVYILPVLSVPQNRRHLHPENKCPHPETVVTAYGKRYFGYPCSEPCKGKIFYLLPIDYFGGASLMPCRCGQCGFSQQYRHCWQRNRHPLRLVMSVSFWLNLQTFISRPDFPHPRITCVGHRTFQLKLSTEILSRCIPSQYTGRLEAESEQKQRHLFHFSFLYPCVHYCTVTVTFSPACHAAGVSSADKRSSKSDTAEAYDAARFFTRPSASTP
ncbi:Uncharacterised protein [Edwardsiella tarda]|nr:Uncharacterised protein [Edwardsiella tarda]